MRSTERSPKAAGSGAGAGGNSLLIDGLDVYYGRAHALQGVSLSLGDGVLAVVGRNGMGKTSLCRAITGMVPASGSVLFNGHELLGRTPDVITRLGVAYVPQGRRVWRSLTVDETLQLASKTARQGAWTVERVYTVFPRLAERRANGGAQLSGGEQQMLAIGRALLFNPRLIVMDEPTEGLAPVIVEQVATLLKALADERSMSVLLIEQNLGVALEVADQVAIMVNGRIAHSLPAAELAADRALQQRLLGLKTGAVSDEPDGEATAPADAPAYSVLRMVRAHGASEAMAPRMIEPSAALEPAPVHRATPATSGVASTMNRERAVYLAGDWAAQPRQLSHLTRCLEQAGARAVTIAITNLSTLSSHDDLGALLVVAKAEDASAAWAGALSLPTGVPMVVVTERPRPQGVAAVFTLVAPIGEFNRVSERVLAQAAAAVAGMLDASPASSAGTKPLVCITSLGAAATAVRNTRRALGSAFDSLVLDMADDGGPTLTRLAGSGLVAGVIDIAPVDVTHAIVNGDERTASERFEALAASGVPYVLVPALLGGDVFPPGRPVPGHLLQREQTMSAQDGSIVPVTTAEARRIGEWLGERLDAFTGPVRLLTTRAGNDAAQQAIQTALLRRFKSRPGRQAGATDHALGDVRFGEALVTALRDLIHQRQAA